MLELAVEDEFKPTRTKRTRKVKAIPKKKAATKKSRKLIKKKRTRKRR